MDDEIVGIALGIDVVATTAHNLAGALEPSDIWLRCADNLALEVGIVILDAIHLMKRK